MGMKGAAFWKLSEVVSLTECRNASSVGSAGRNRRRLERQMLRLVRVDILVCGMYVTLGKPVYGVDDSVCCSMFILS